MAQKINMKNPAKKDYLHDEAIKTLRSNILFTSKKTKVILITSCFPNEGKSDITFSISAEMGKFGKRILLLDTDIRKSVYAKRHSVNQEINGLSQYLSGQVEEKDIIYSTNYENVDIIFAGHTAPNPSELLGDGAFGELLNNLREEYDYIFVDSPPVGTVIDAAVVAENCDGAVLVIESSAVSYKSAQKVKAQLERSGCSILGAVLNKVDIKRDRYYSYYNKNYSKYYNSK